MKNSEIKEILNHCENKLKEFSLHAENGEINRVDIKNMLENMRSILDYLAQDILRSFKTRCGKKIKDKIYFPYGEKKSHFEKSIKDNLPGLNDYMPDVYGIIEGCQGYVCNNSWLHDLCYLTNDVKHNKLGITRKDTLIKIQQPGIYVEVPEGSDVTISGNVINGELQDGVVLNRSGDIDVVRNSGGTFISKQSKIIFYGKEIEVVQFFENCLRGLNKLVLDVEGSLSNYASR
jgi:hypothetical protein